VVVEVQGKYGGLNKSRETQLLARGVQDKLRSMRVEEKGRDATVSVGMYTL
jgi:hypothetical protein